MKVNGQLHARTVSPPGKNLDAHWIRVWVNTTAGLQGFETRTLQPVGNSYTDYAIQAVHIYIYIYIYIHVRIKPI
jgi:hypothetical protein